MILSRNFFKSILSRYINCNGEPMIRTTSDNLISAPIHSLMIKVMMKYETSWHQFELINVAYWQGFPLSKRINWMLMQLTESGLINFWASNIINRRVVPKNLHAPYSLSWDHLEGAFFALAFGLILSLWIFGVEYCLGLWLKRSVKAN